MARSPAEIQADIAVTRRLVERQLDAVERRVPHGWWVPYASVAGALAVGLLLSYVPFFRLVSVGARATKTGLAVAPALSLVRGFLTEHRRSRAA
jgi:uncharacterized protein (DUF2062 family)